MKNARQLSFPGITPSKPFQGARPRAVETCNRLYWEVLGKLPGWAPITNETADFYGWSDK